MHVNEFLASLGLTPAGALEGCSADWFARTESGSGVRVILGVSDGLLTVAATEHPDNDDTIRLAHVEADVANGDMELTQGDDAALQQIAEIVQALPSPRSVTGLGPILK